MKILVVDDIKENLYMLEALLKGYGYEVKSAIDAMEKVSHEEFDMIISDILMPRMDGFQLCQKIKKNKKFKDMAFVFYTASYTDPKDEEFALNLGAEKFIVKPTEPEEFVNMLREVIKSREMGTLVAPKASLKDETVYVKQYNERLIRKLEEKMLDLERVNKKLQKSEEKYKELIDRANDAVIVMKPTGNLSFVNPKFCEMTGYTIEEAKTLQFDKMIHPEDRATVMKNFSKRMAGEAMPGSYEFRGLTKSGEVVYAEVNATSIEKEGKIVETMAIIRDITKRKHAEERLRKSFEKRKELEDIINNSLAVVFLWRAAEGWPVEFVSDNVKQFGYTSEDFYSERIIFANIIHPDDLERVVAGVTRYSQKGYKDFVQEYRIITKSGKVHWIDDRTWIRRDSNGVVTHYQGIVLDITRRKQAEEEIRMLAHTLRNINDCVNISDLENNIILVNKAFYDVYGYKKEEIFGKNTNILWSPLTPKEITREILSKTLKGGWQGELYNRRKDGSDFPIYLSTSVIRDEKGKLMALVGVSRDITEQKQAQEEKEKLQARLLQAQKMEAIGTLAGGIAHDFNNILTPILGYVDLVQQDISPDSEAYSDLEHVTQAANRAKDLVKQILTFSRQVEKERKPVKIHLMIKEALKLIRATLPTTIDIRQNIDTACKAVLADPVQIHQVLMNLCTNAYHAMRENGGLLEVKLAMVEVDAELALDHSNLKEGKYVRLTVSDTGHGMDSATMERIFEPFFTTKNIGEGTGLGLSVVHGIVVSHGGKIIVESEPGKGTTFNVYWPQASSDVEQKVSTDEPIPKGNERILFVDDEEEIALMGKRILERLGYKVTIKTNSLEALKAFRAHPDKFDLVITDQTMPNMTGLQLAKKLLHFRSEIPIILITGFSEKVTLEITKKIGISEYIMKPIIVRNISKAIRGALNPKK